MTITELTEKNEPQILDLVHNKSLISYVKNDRIIRNVPIQTVLVSSDSDLELLQDYSPGTIAYTAGYQQMWQKSPNGTWSTFE